MTAAMTSSLPIAVAGATGRMGHMLIEAILGTDPLTVRRNAADLCMTALTKGATNGRLLPHVWREFNREDGPGGHSCLKGDNLWSLYNAFTEVEKTSDSPAESQRRTARLSTILDGTCHAIDDAREECWVESLVD